MSYAAEILPLDFDDLPPLLTYKQAGQLLGGISARSVSRMADEGILERRYPRPRCPRITKLSVYQQIAGESEPVSDVVAKRRIAPAKRKPATTAPPAASKAARELDALLSAR